jgi:sucrose phosphorylase
LDVYQINCTYYSALGEDDAAYLMARSVQFFTPGIPQVYYVGLLAGRNDLELVERTKVGRDINRHGYSLEEIESQISRPVVQKLLALMKLRNNHPAFGGDFGIEQSPDTVLTVCWKKGIHTVRLQADFEARCFKITTRSGDSEEQVLFSEP